MKLRKAIFSYHRNVYKIEHPIFAEVTSSFEKIINTSL